MQINRTLPINPGCLSHCAQPTNLSMESLSEFGRSIKAFTKSASKLNVVAQDTFSAFISLLINWTHYSRQNIHYGSVILGTLVSVEIWLVDSVISWRQYKQNGCVGFTIIRLSAVQENEPIRLSEERSRRPDSRERRKSSLIIRLQTRHSKIQQIITS